MTGAGRPAGDERLRLADRRRGGGRRGRAARRRPWPSTACWASAPASSRRSPSAWCWTPPARHRGAGRLGLGLRPAGPGRGLRPPGPAAGPASGGLTRGTAGASERAVDHVEHHALGIEQQHLAVDHDEAVLRPLGERGEQLLRQGPASRCRPAGRRRARRRTGSPGAAAPPARPARCRTRHGWRRRSAAITTGSGPSGACGGRAQVHADPGPGGRCARGRGSGPPPAGWRAGVVASSAADRTAAAATAAAGPVPRRGRGQRCDRHGKLLREVKPSRATPKKLERCPT